MATKSKFFRVATEGATTDGRKIERKWLEEMAETYNRATYGARMFIEHIRGLNPEWGFRCMGDVLALKVEEVEGGKLALFAQLEPTAEMVEWNRKGQKIYSSIEVQENFAGTGKAYLVGIGVTDSPATLGSEILAFAAQHPAANPFTTRKHSPETMFSAAEPCEIEFIEETAMSEESLLDRVKKMFTKSEEKATDKFADVHAAVEQVATEVASVQQSAQDDHAALQQKFSALETKFNELEGKFNVLPNGEPQRPPATGANSVIETDC